MTAPLAFLDTETTGLHADRRPWEIAIIRRDEHGQRELLIQVEDVDLASAELIGLNIGGFHDRHVRFNGLDPEGVGRHRKGWDGMALLPEREAARAVEQWTRGAHIVGAVPNFDTECLAAMLRRHGLCPAWHYHLIDVETLAMGYVFGGGRTDAMPREVREIAALPWKSDELSRAVGVAPPSEDERHTAMGDARWAMRLYDHITGGKA